MPATISAASNKPLPAPVAGFFVPENPAEPGRGHRLVKGSKCPTPPQAGPDLENPAPMQGKTPPGEPGAWGVIEYREWAQEWRIRTQVETTAGSAPPDNSGNRETDHLTERAAKIIAESCQYVATCKGGYRTFFTLTLDNLTRYRVQQGAEIVAGPFSQWPRRPRRPACSWLAGPDYPELCHKETARLVTTTIQREVSRFMDGLSRMYSRGWRAEFTRGGRKFYQADRNGDPDGEPGRAGELLYCWVAECPTNERGEENPHVHVMLNWRVKYRLFAAWAARIEALWAQGFAHIEKLRDAHAAGGYMLKALGYMTKGKAGEQGTIRGNRYNLSAAARAPGWVCIERKQLHALGVMIADIQQHVTEQYGELYQERKRAAADLATIPKHKPGIRRAVSRRLERVRRILAESVPVVASKYQIIVRGAEAFREVRAWLASPGHWRAPVPWLPEKGPGEYWDTSERSESQWFAEQKRRIWWRRACRVAEAMKITDTEWQACRDQFQEWADILAARDNGEPQYGFI